MLCNILVFEKHFLNIYILSLLCLNFAPEIEVTGQYL